MALQISRVPSFYHNDMSFDTKDSRQALPGISTVKPSSSLARSSSIQAHVRLANATSLPMGFAENSRPLKRKRSNDSGVDFENETEGYRASKHLDGTSSPSTVRLPSVSHLLRDLPPAAPPTPASTVPSTVASPVDPAVPVESFSEKRRRQDSDLPSWHHSTNLPNSHLRRTSGPDYGRRFPPMCDSPQAVSSNSPPSVAPSHRPSYAGTSLPSTLHPPTDPGRSAPLPQFQRTQPYGASEGLPMHSRWPMEGPPPPPPSQYVYSREPHWGAVPPAYGELRQYDPHYHSTQITFHPVGGHGDGTLPRKRRGNLPKEATAILKAWYHAHQESPYPTEDDKIMLCNQAQLSMNQVSNWFINARRRQPGREKKQHSGGVRVVKPT